MKKVIFIAILLIGIVSAQSCSDIYYFIVENSWDYNDSDLNKSNITQQEIDDYAGNCYLMGFEPLPEKQKKKITVYEGNSTKKCEHNLFFLFDVSIPFFQLDLGDIRCSFKKKLNYFLVIEESSNTIIGIRIFPIVIFIMFITIYFIIKENRKLNEIDKYLNGRNH